MKHHNQITFVHLPYEQPGYKVFFFGQTLQGDTMEVTTLFVVNVSLDEEWKKEQER